MAPVFEVFGRLCACFLLIILGLWVAHSAIPKEIDVTRTAWDEAARFTTFVVGMIFAIVMSILSFTIK